MGHPALIGATAPGGTYTARYLHWSDHPDRLIPVLRQIWTDTFDTDTTRMVAALLARDWSSLAAQPSSSVFPPLVVAGVGVESPGGTRPSRYVGRIATANSGDMEWLYLIDTATDTIAVYEATCHYRWLRHSVHHLQPVAELFTVVDATGALACTVCGAVDETDHQEMPSMVGYGRDTATRCTRCRSSVTTDPVFGAHTNRSDTSQPD